MKNRSERLGLARSLIALAVSFAVVLSTTALSFASRTASSARSATKSNVAQAQTGSTQNELKITSVTATKTTAGVLLEWRTNATKDNVGFNVYRVKDGRRTRANREIIPGALFGPDPTNVLRGGYSFAWLDRAGTADSVYYIESVNLQGASKMHDAVGPVANPSGAVTPQTPESLAGPESEPLPEKSYPDAESQQLDSLTGALEDQFAIAAQSALKIAIKKDGWYRVTQPQMVAAGFNPTVDIRNLRLYDEAQELAISTSQSSGQFGASDYLEFYGRGLDTPTTDTRIYYLLAGTTPGKRVIGQNHTNEDSDPPAGPIATPTPAPVSTPVPISTPPVSSSPPVTTAPSPEQPILSDPIFYGWPQNDAGLLSWLRPGAAPATRETSAPVGNSQTDQPAADSSQPGYTAPVADYARPAKANEIADAPVAVIDPAASAETSTNEAKQTRELGRNVPANEIPSVVRLPVPANASPAGKPEGRVAAKSQFRKNASSRKRTKRARSRRPLRAEHSHAVFSLAAAPSNFVYTVERKDRLIYFVPVLNGDQENYFGQVLGFSPVSQTINSPNRDLSAGGTAPLEIALQGANAGFHQISVEFNGVAIGSFLFNGIDPSSGGHPVKVFDIPLSQLNDGANTLRFVPAGSDLCLVDYAKLTYPHAYKADAGSLKFSLRGTQSRKVDGFATSRVRLIDYTDPFNLIVTKPDAEPSAAGFAITVPPGAGAAKTQRLLYALPQGQFETPAAFSLNQPSTLHQGNLSGTIPNGADFLIITHKTLLSSMTPLLNLRQSQGKIAAAVDIEDVYDEFSYGTHGPQAIRAFLSHATTNWVTKPRYVIFAGDASLDPRNYENLGNLDFVPTKLIDATYNETASDDWLADFNNDGIADIPVGRLPARTPAEANLMISKIVGYSPATVPQSALLIADDPGTPALFDFETGNDQVQALLPASMPVQRVNVRTANGQATTQIQTGLTEGRSIVNYSGHGTLDSWASSVIFTTAQALALTQGTDKLPFVIVMDCLNGYFQAPNVLSLSEAFVKAPSGGAIAVFASSGLTTTPGQREMELELYRQLYGPQIIPVGDAIRIAKAESGDIDVRRTWILFGDPSMKIR